MKEKKCYVKTGKELPQEEQKKLTYQALCLLNERFNRAATRDEVMNYLNEANKPLVVFGKRQTWKNLYMLEKVDKKVKSMSERIDDKQTLYYSPIKS
jgi:hypothetical protein